MPIVSFIITYYNEPLPLLACCLRSVLDVCSLMGARGMSRDDFEIIVVDDGSAASPLEALRQMDDGIRYLRQDNAGLSAARNAGLDVARGTYVQFVDADDALLPQAYCSLCPQDANGADLILFRLTTREACLDKAAHRCPPAGSQARPWKPAPQRGAGQKGTWESGICHMLHHNLRASACGYLFRRSLLHGLRFADGLLHEDELFTPLLLLRMGSVSDTSVPAYYYRQRPHSITHSQTASQVARRLDDTLEVLCRLRDEASRLEGAGRRALMRRVEQLTGDYIYNVCSLVPDQMARQSRMCRLAREHFLPLPVRAYTPRHWLFSLVARLPFPMLDRLMRLVVHAPRQRVDEGDEKVS